MFILADTSLDTIPKFFQKGGWFMVPLAICSLVSVTIALLRAFALRRESVLPAVVENEIERFQPGGSAEQLARLVGDDPAALSCLTRVALGHVRVSRAENSEAVQTRARREIMRLESGLAVLELIVGISPLLGLLGAIVGLVRVFSNLSVEMESLMADLLSKCYYRKAVRPGTPPPAEDAASDYEVTTPATFVPQARRLAQAPVTQPGGTENEPL
jgi:biopolymer transport protein ExbB/TolQ